MSVHSGCSVSVNSSSCENSHLTMNFHMTPTIVLLYSERSTLCKLFSLLCQLPQLSLKWHIKKKKCLSFCEVCYGSAQNVLVFVFCSAVKSCDRLAVQIKTLSLIHCYCRCLSEAETLKTAVVSPQGLILTFGPLSTSCVWSSCSCWQPL